MVVGSPVQNPAQKSRRTPEGTHVTKLCLNQELYSAAAVKCAQDAFRDVCVTAMTENPPYYVLEITTDDPADEREVAAEFGNYALAAMVEEHRN